MGKQPYYPCLEFIPKIIGFLGYVPKGLFKADSVGNELRAYRQLHGLTQKDLAKQLGVDPSSIMDWENQNHKISKKNVPTIKIYFVSLS
ncbi:MAG: helix-turn-helix transcriptional regulator [Anaerohalosphaeraceae bacterium]